MTRRDEDESTNEDETATNTKKERRPKATRAETTHTTSQAGSRPNPDTSRVHMYTHTNEIHSHIDNRGEGGIGKYLEDSL